VSVRGISLEPGTIVVLELDGTLVYVEDVQPTYAAVVALPDQPAGRALNHVFTPGKVGAKKISPYSSIDKAVPVADLSDRNREFVGTFETLRNQHGPHFVVRNPEDQVTVTKAQPVKSREKLSDSDRQNRRKERRAKKRASKCAQCGQQSGHPNHPNDHAFIAPSDEAAPAPRARKSRSAEPRFRIVSTDLTKARTASDKFADGNRFHRVFRALSSLGEGAFSVDDITAALVKDGGKMPANPDKVTRRALSQLTTFGNTERE